MARPHPPESASPLRRAHAAVRSAGIRPAVPGLFGLMRGVHRAMRGVAHLGHALDDRLHPQWRDTEIGEPVFILACPRSGTTLLHRLMSLDTERFTSLRLWQTLLPGVSYTRAIEVLGHADAAVGAPFERAVRWADDRLFGTWDHIHRVGFNDAEEDEWLWMNEGHSPAWLLFYPAPSALAQQTDAGALDDATRETLRQHYADALRRARHAAGGERTLLLKNALAGGRLELLDAVAPRARYVQLVRDPYRSVTSFVSMFYNVIRVMTADTPPDGRVTRELCALGCDHYLQMDRFIRALPAERAITVRYDDLVTSPADVTTRVYAHFGLPVSDPYRARLEEATRAQRAYSSRHDYSLEMFGLRPEDIHGPLAEVFERYGFARRPEA